MRHVFISVLLLGVSLLTLSEPLSAHHGSAVYDMENMTTVKGTVTEFQFSNPHAQILFDVKDDKGNVEDWLAECPGPNRMAKGGWTKDTLKPQDEITITGNPTKDGSKSIRLESVVLPNGQELRGRVR